MYDRLKPHISLSRRGDHLRNISDRVGGCSLDRVFSSNDLVTVWISIITGQAERKYYSNGNSTGANTAGTNIENTHTHTHTHTHRHTGRG